MTAGFSDLRLAGPLVVVAVFGVLTLALGLGRRGRDLRGFCGIGLGTAVIAALLSSGRPARSAFGQMLAMDDYALLLQGVVLGLGGAALARLRPTEGRPGAAGPALVLLALAGLLLVVSAADLMALFLGAELAVVALTLLCAVRGRMDGAFRLLMGGGISTAVILYGLALVFGEIGSTRLTDLHGWLAIHSPQGADHADLVEGGVTLVVLGSCLLLFLTPTWVWRARRSVGGGPAICLGAAVPVAVVGALGRLLWVGLEGAHGAWVTALVTLGTLGVLLGAVGLWRREPGRVIAAAGGLGVGTAVLALGAAWEAPSPAVVSGLVVIALAICGAMVSASDLAGPEERRWTRALPLVVCLSGLVVVPLWWVWGGLLRGHALLVIPTALLVVVRLARGVGGWSAAPLSPATSRSGAASAGWAAGFLAGGLLVLLLGTPSSLALAARCLAALWRG